MPLRALLIGEGAAHGIDPDAALEGLAQGFLLSQGHRMSQGALLIKQALENPGATLTPTATPHTIETYQERMAHTIATAFGKGLGQYSAALGTEGALAGRPASPQAPVFWACEAIENPDHYRRAVEYLRCARLYGVRSNGLKCAACGSRIESGQFLRKCVVMFLCC